jgi:hypothetical protein
MVIDDLFKNISKDLSLALAKNSKYLPFDKFDEHPDIDQRIAAAAFGRLLGRVLMIGGVGVALVAVPILSSPIGVLYLAFGVGMYIAGHDVFIVSKNVDNHYRSICTPVGTFVKATARNWWADIIGSGEKNVEDKSILKDFTNYTYLQPIYLDIYSLILAANSKK